MNWLLILAISLLLVASFLMYKMHFGNVKKYHVYGKDRRKIPASIMIVVGSGGHTREILCLVKQLGKNYCPRYYIVADTDKMSEKKVHSLEEEYEQNVSSLLEYEVMRIPRSREVKQSWFSTILSTIYASLYTFPVVFKRKPEIIVCNGPGTCIPVCLAGLILRWLHIQSTEIVYVESICRVTSLSLSAKILYYFADHMFVQWQGLQQKYPKCHYYGRIV